MLIIGHSYIFVAFPLSNRSDYFIHRWSQLSFSTCSQFIQNKVSAQFFLSKLFSVIAAEMQARPQKVKRGREPFGFTYER